MQGETQLHQLQEMMQKHKRNPEYSLTLPPFAVKKKSLKKLSQNDLLLLGMEKFELQLRQDDRFFAKVALESHGDSIKLNIISLKEESAERNDSKKYEDVICYFESVQSRKIELGHKVEIPSLELSEVTLLIQGEMVAKGNLVTVEKKLAIVITEVNRDE